MTGPPLTGSVAPGFEEVRRAFAATLDPSRGQDRETGAAVAVVRGDETLVDLAGGWVDANRGRPWRPDTLVSVFSAGKPFCALAALTVVRDGALDLDSPICEVWPAYGAFGKHATTIRDLLRHRAAQPAFPETIGPHALLDPKRLETALAAAPPEWEPGTAPAEHALTYGHLLAPALRGATGRGLGDLIREGVAGPLDLDLHLGVVEADLARVAELEAGPGWPAIATGEPGTLRHRALTRPEGALDPVVLNRRAWRAAEFGAIGVHATARALARFYGALLDPAGPVACLLGQELWCAATAGGPPEQDRLLGRPVQWTIGGFQSDLESLGLAAVGGTTAFADRRRGIGVAYVTRRLSSHARSGGVIEAIGACT